MFEPSSHHVGANTVSRYVIDEDNTVVVRFFCGRYSARHIHITKEFRRGVQKFYNTVLNNYPPALLPEKPSEGG